MTIGIVGVLGKESSEYRTYGLSSGTNTIGVQNVVVSSETAAAAQNHLTCASSAPSKRSPSFISMHMRLYNTRFQRWRPRIVMAF
ncbi:hypothetical protein PVAP13_2KG585700 [Panicum virgatum]|uniref:Uncharacterized protein n=1 Tax=Panicum virgatum TaxID=38727 RepID=A0A8T0WDI1_PANVG|nr:hypothetical protein PVAP13_2KG585700 [Panicum virgatum]